MIESGTVTAVAVAITAIVTALMAYSTRREAHKAQVKLDEKAKFEAALEARRDAERAEEKRQTELRDKMRLELEAELLEKTQQIHSQTNANNAGIEKIAHQTNSAATEAQELAKKQAETIKELKDALNIRDAELSANMRRDIATAVTEALASHAVPTLVEVVNTPLEVKPAEGTK